MANSFGALKSVKKNGFFTSEFGSRTYTFNNKTFLTGDRGYMTSDFGALPFYLINEGIIPNYESIFEPFTNGGYFIDGYTKFKIDLYIDKGKAWYNNASVLNGKHSIVGGYYIKNDEDYYLLHSVEIDASPKSFASGYDYKCGFIFIYAELDTSQGRRQLVFRTMSRSFNGDASVLDNQENVFDLYYSRYKTNGRRFIVPFFKIEWQLCKDVQYPPYSLAYIAEDYRGEDGSTTGHPKYYVGTTAPTYSLYCPFAKRVDSEII